MGEFPNLSRNVPLCPCLSSFQFCRFWGPGRGQIGTKSTPSKWTRRVRKLLLTPAGDSRRAPSKQTVGTVTTSHKMLSLRNKQFELSQCQRCEERLHWPSKGSWVNLRQSVPHKGRVHLLCIDKGGQTGTKRGISWGQRKGIPKNLSSQVFGEVRVNFSG